MGNMRTSLLFLLALAGPSLGQSTHRVPRDWPTIQAAVDVAASGDTILVGPGTYFENLVVDGKELDLVGELGASATVIDGAHLETVVRLQNGAHGRLAGFTIRNGSAPSAGGGIRVEGASPHIDACRVENNHALSDGGGIYVLGGAPKITDCVVRANGTLYWDGGGIFLAIAQGAVITNCTVVDNVIPSEGWGGGIWDHTGGIVISNCVVRDNEAGFFDWDIGSYTGTRIQYTNYGESQGKHGNIDVPARFVDQAAGDVHLRADSPCIGAGLADAPGVPASDPDGNPRGATVDMGADQYGPAAYLVGRAEAGFPVTVRVGGGPPGAGAVVWCDGRLLKQHQDTPWGDWWLESRRMLTFAGTLGAEGWTSGTWTVPTGTGFRRLFSQGLVGLELTPVSVKNVD